MNTTQSIRDTCLRTLLEDHILVVDHGVLVQLIKDSRRLFPDGSNNSVLWLNSGVQYLAILEHWSELQELMYISDEKEFSDKFDAVFKKHLNVNSCLKPTVKWMIPKWKALLEKKKEEAEKEKKGKESDSKEPSQPSTAETEQRYSSFDHGRFQSRRYKSVKGESSIQVPEGDPTSFNMTFVYTGSFRSGTRITIPMRQLKFGVYVGFFGDQPITLTLELPVEDLTLRGSYSTEMPEDRGDISLLLKEGDIHPLGRIPYALLGGKGKE